MDVPDTHLPARSVPVRSGLPSRRPARLVPGLVLCVVASGCLTLLGGEQRVGDQAAAEIERETGVVASPALEAYVRAIGMRLAAGSSREGPWRFVVLDDPVPNAFALPGGHVYVTRGLLALVNSEDELAGVVGHEIGHVLGGHGGKRITLGAPFAVLTGITSFATGLVLPRLGQAVAEGGSALSQGLVIAPYSRQQEREADRIGQELAAAAGWDPAGLSRSLANLGRATDLLQGAARGSSWLDTHPGTDERVETTAEHAGRLAWTPREPVAPDRRAVLERLDGLRVGRDPSFGVFVGDRFVRPDWRVSIAFPDGWAAGGNAALAAAGSPSQDAMLLLGFVEPGDDPRAAIRSLEEETGRPIEVEEVRLGDRRALRSRGSERARGGTVDFVSTWVALGGNVFRLLALSDARRSEAWRPVLETAEGSLREASGEEISSVTERRLRMVEARAGEDASRLAARVGSPWSGEVVEVVNGLAAGARLEAGQLLKVARTEPYAPRMPHRPRQASR